MSELNFNIPFDPFIPKANNFQILTGQRKGKLLVISLFGKRNKATMWLCLCDCGDFSIASNGDLNSNHAQSCGCRKRAVLGEQSYVHGEARLQGPSRETVEYRAYCSARNRCNNPTNAAYADYGGRSIEFRFESYPQFLEEMGRRPSNQHSLNRIDNNGHYEKGNVEWATGLKQRRYRRNVQTLTLDGTTKPLGEWADLYNQPPKRLYRRIFTDGWSVHTAITKP